MGVLNKVDGVHFHVQCALFQGRRMLTMLRILGLSALSLVLTRF